MGYVAIALVTGGELAAVWLGSEYESKDGYGNGGAVADWLSLAATLFGTLTRSVSNLEKAHPWTFLS
jgi:hypothetical protein